MLLIAARWGQRLAILGIYGIHSIVDWLQFIMKVAVENLQL